MPSGSRRPAVECGLGGEFVERVKKAGGGVWSRRENLFCGSKDMSAECGLEREITA